MEIGPKDVEKKTVRLVRRFDGVKTDIPADTCVAAVQVRFRGFLRSCLAFLPPLLSCHL